MDVTITPITKADKLHCHYDGELRAQPVVLALDLEDGELTCRYNPEVGGNAVPESVWSGRTIWVDMPPLTAEYANQLMESVKPLAQRILDGSDIAWDGNSDRGTLNEDAQAALAELTAACAEENFDATVQVVEYDADDWYMEFEQETFDRVGLTADTTDAELDQMAAAEEELATTHSSNYGYTILRGAGDWLSNRRKEMRDKVRDELADTAEQHQNLEQRRDAGIRRVASWGDDSSRAIGALVGLSHTRVQQIAKKDTAEDGQ